jgi:hypothetical protein
MVGLNLSLGTRLSLFGCLIVVDTTNSLERNHM